jgi:alcohol dehydrogenase class IV
MNFEFATANRIIFGPGVLRQTGPLAAGLGHRAFVVTGRTAERANPLLNLLADHGLDLVTFAVAGEPTIELVQQGTHRARANKCDLVVGFGGGSVLDAGKAIAAMLTNRGKPLDYLEVVGGGQKIEQPPAPYLAIPTTAGTGTEVTRNAVLGSPEHRVKVSMRSPLLLPRLALVDPELTYDLPPALTASTGLDALTQVLEPYVSHLANPLTDAVCREGLARAARSLRRAYQNGGDDETARQDMALASLCGGLALANAKLGAVHGFAGPFGGMFPAPHGATCAALLPHVMAINVQALQGREPDNPALVRYDNVARLLTGDDAATAAAGVDWVAALCRDLQIPGLAAYGLTPADFPDLIEKARQASSMKGNPIQLTVEELGEILERAM